MGAGSSVFGELNMRPVGGGDGREAHLALFHVIEYDLARRLRGINGHDPETSTERQRTYIARSQ